MVTKRDTVPAFTCTLVYSFPIFVSFPDNTIFGFWCFFLFQIGDALIEIASNIMLVDDHVLWMAQKEDKACTRIVRCVEHIASQMLTSNIQVISKVFHKITKLFVRIYFKNVTFLHNFYNHEYIEKQDCVSQIHSIADLRRYTWLCDFYFFFFS